MQHSLPRSNHIIILEVHIFVCPHAWRHSRTHQRRAIGNGVVSLGITHEEDLPIAHERHDALEALVDVRLDVSHASLTL